MEETDNRFQTEKETQRERECERAVPQYCLPKHASSPITSWQIDGETVETVDDFIFGGSKITADGDCSLN